jgi:hypothetical protein
MVIKDLKNDDKVEFQERDFELERMAGNLFVSEHQIKRREIG